MCFLSVDIHNPCQIQMHSCKYTKRFYLLASRSTRAAGKIFSLVRRNFAQFPFFILAFLYADRILSTRPHFPLGALSLPTYSPSSSVRQCWAFECVANTRGTPASAIVWLVAC